MEAITFAVLCPKCKAGGIKITQIKAKEYEYEECSFCDEIVTPLFLKESKGRWIKIGEEFPFKVMPYNKKSLPVELYIHTPGVMFDEIEARVIDLRQRAREKGIPMNIRRSL